MSLLLFFSAVPSSATMGPQGTTVVTASSGAIVWMPLLSALIGVAAALTTPIVKDVFISKWNEKRERARTQREILRNYLAPLADSCQKLVWRFSEVFIESRHQWLMTKTLPIEYNEYKRQSTLYRIACLLGWIRAISLELSALPRGRAGFSSPISKAISKVQTALADGPHVEIHRLERLCSVWGLEYDQLAASKRQSVATQLEVRLFSLAGVELRRDSNALRDFDSGKKRDVCLGLAQFLCAELGRAPLNPQLIDESIHKAIDSLSYREALIFRDWQDAIGDAVLEKDEDSVRRFKIVGYEKFAEVLKAESLWMDVFRTSIVDLDLETVDPSDFRYQQLKDLAIAVAEILISLTATDEKDLVDPDALELCARLKALNELSPSP